MYPPTPKPTEVTGYFPGFLHRRARVHHLQAHQFTCRQVCALCVPLVFVRNPRKKGGPCPTLSTLYLRRSFHHCCKSFLDNEVGSHSLHALTHEHHPTTLNAGNFPGQQVLSTSHLFLFAVSALRSVILTRPYLLSSTLQDIGKCLHKLVLVCDGDAQAATTQVGVTRGCSRGRGVGVIA